jgi:hypothetical protein
MIDGLWLICGIVVGREEGETVFQVQTVCFCTLFSGEGHDSNTPTNQPVNT